LLPLHIERIMMDLEELAVMTPKKFAVIIEEIVKEGKGGVNYMEAILEYCERHEMEPDSIAPLISKPLKEKIEADARELNFLPRVATLPI
jgi:hypothetical protein